MSLTKLRQAIPTVACKGKCQKFCCPVLASEEEVREAEKRYPNYQRTTMNDFKARVMGGLGCRHLDADGRCSVYEARPLICRLFGAGTDAMMRCPHGCQVLGKPVNSRQGHKIINRSKVGGTVAF